LPTTTHRFGDYEYDIELTPLDPSPYDLSTIEARITRIARVLPDGGREQLDERAFRIVTGRDRDEALTKIDAAVRYRLG
jgi:hypothetical protein